MGEDIYLRVCGGCGWFWMQATRSADPQSSVCPRCGTHGVSWTVITEAHAREALREACSYVDLAVIDS